MILPKLLQGVMSVNIRMSNSCTESQSEVMENARDTKLESSTNIKTIGKSHWNNHMPLKPVKIIKKGLCSVSQNDLMHLRMNNGDFCSKVWVRKMWVTAGLRVQPDAGMEEANVSCCYVTFSDHQALTLSAQDNSGCACSKKEEIQHAKVQRT